MVGLSDSVPESTVVEAPEKSVGKVRLVSVLRRCRGGVPRHGCDLKEESCACVERDSEDRRAVTEGGSG